MTTGTARFHIGQIVRHSVFGYRGVVYDIDGTYQGTEKWYAEMARSRPPRDKPWYHVLVHRAGHTTYVAERNLEPDPDTSPITHPALTRHFTTFGNGRYHTGRAVN